MNEFKSVYVFKSANGYVKIGVSSDVENRKSHITCVSGFKIADYYCTEPCSNAYEIEHDAHNHFNYCRLQGEWFDCSFNEAAAYVGKVFNELAKFDQHEDHTLDYLKTLTDIPQSNGKHEEEEETAGEVSSLIKNVRIVMERQESHPRKIAKQTELLLVHFGIPVIEDFVEPAPWEQMELA